MQDTVIREEMKDLAERVQVTDPEWKLGQQSLSVSTKPRNSSAGISPTGTNPEPLSTAQICTLVNNVTKKKRWCGGRDLCLGKSFEARL